MSKDVAQRLLCPGCGSAMPGLDRYCGVCGARLSERAATELLADPTMVAAKSEGLALANTTSFQVGQVIEGRYRIVELVARGGMASVFRVEQIHLRKQLALKILHENLVVHPAAVARFIREARAISKLENGHTVRLFDFGKLGDVFYLVMEYIEGRDLESLLHEFGRLDPLRAVEIAVQVCESLEEAHAHGIVHRDLKPENIMMVKQKEGGDVDFVKVLDFGLAQMHEGEEAVTQHSRAALFGTPYYMAPEQIRGDRIDARTDLYALGAVIYRMLAGRCPFVARSTFDVLAQHLDSPVPSFADAAPGLKLSAALEKIVVRCLAKLPEERFSSAAELRRALLQFRVESEQPVSLPASASVAVLQSSEEGAPPVVDPPAPSPNPVRSVPKASIRVSPPPDDSVGDSVGDDDDDEEYTISKKPWFSRWMPAESNGLASILTKDYQPDVAEDPGDVSDVEARRKQWKWAAAVSVIVVVFGLSVWGLGGSSDPHLDPKLEHEPNDTKDQASHAALDTEISGVLLAKLGDEPADVDFFQVSRDAGDSLYDVYVESTANADIAVRIHGSSPGKGLEINHLGAGLGERVTRLRPPPGKSWALEVYSPKRAKLLENLEYRLQIKQRNSRENEELEPNHTVETATEVPHGQPISARTDGPFDNDWFRITDVPHNAQLWTLSVSGGGAVVRHVRLRGADRTVQIHWTVGGDGTTKAVTPGDPTGIRYVEVVCGQGQRCIGDYVLTVTRKDQSRVVEREPNPTFADSTDVVLGQAVAGALNDRDDVDVFRVPVRGLGRKFHVILHTEGSRRVDVHVCNEGCTAPTVVSLKQGRTPGLAEPVLYVTKEKDEVLYVRLSGEGSRRPEPYVLTVVPVSTDP